METRQSEETETIVSELKTMLREEPEKPDELRLEYMQETLNYMEHFWNGLFLYRNDGRYPIDNNLAERTIRPFKMKRKNSLHFSSDAGAQMCAVYQSIVSTVKMQGKSVWDFFGKFFRGTVMGTTDYMDIIPQRI